MNSKDLTLSHHIYEETFSVPSRGPQLDQDAIAMETNKAYQIATGPNAAYNARKEVT